MDEVIKQASDLQKEVNLALGRLHFDDLVKQRNSLEVEMGQPSFWENSNSAQDISKKHVALTRRLQPWENIKTSIEEVLELARMGDEKLKPDLTNQISATQGEYEKLKGELRFSGPYDDRGVILSIFAGAGGTDAQDWAQMLLRMYVRWTEKEKLSIKVMDESSGDEAGIKSVTCEIDGSLIYGKLKGEHGVHRLVRLSPFNADHLRQTSFAKVEILPKVDKPEDLEIDEKDLRIDVYHAGGHGGQSVNTTDSAVRITHLPTGISVAIQNERSQLQNKEAALTILRSKLIQLQLEQHQEKIDELKGPIQSAEWGNQIRSYVLHPYKQVKDLRTRYETSDVDGVLDGNLDGLIDAYLDYSIGSDK
jgi:peptide chain release factor 2